MYVEYCYPDRFLHWEVLGIVLVINSLCILIDRTTSLETTGM